MNTDIRIKTSFPNHPKTKKFIKTVGPLGGWMLMKLWVFTAQNKPDGLLTNMDASDICDVMEFKGNPRMMIHALLDCSSGADSLKACPGCDVCEKGKLKKRARWLDKTSSGFYQVHDWEVHNPYACKAPARIERAKKGAAARIEKLHNQRLMVSSKQNQAELQADGSSAPAPVPVPSPVPSPLEESGFESRSNTNGKNSPQRFEKIAFEKAESAWTEFESTVVKSTDRVIISDSLSQKIYFDMGGREKILELHSQNSGHLRRNFVTLYAALDIAKFKASLT